MSMERTKYASAATIASITSSRSAPSVSANSLMVGSRPRVCASAVVALVICECNSLSLRGTCIIQALSRKCRRTSPIMVGTA